MLKEVPTVPPLMALIDKAAPLVSESPASAPVPLVPAVPRAAVGDPIGPARPATFVSATTTTGLAKFELITAAANGFNSGDQPSLLPSGT